MFPIYSWICGLLEPCLCTSHKLLKETYSPCPRSYQLTITPYLGESLCDTPHPISGFLSVLSLNRFYTCGHNPCGMALLLLFFSCHNPPALVLTIFPPCYLQRYLYLGVGWDINVPFRVKNPTVS